MKRILTIILIPFLLLSCDWRNLSECSSIDCVSLDINTELTINLNLSKYDSTQLDSVALVLYDRYNSTPLDTIIRRQPEYKQILIGGGAEITFGEPADSQLLEEVEYDYTIHIPATGDVHYLDNISIELISGECCSAYEISTLDLNSETLTFNSYHVVIEL